MVTQLLDRVPAERIQAEARRFQLGRTLLLLFMGIFWVVGWLAGALALAVGYAWASVREGWRDVHALADRLAEEKRRARPAG
jgi:hypothetical protein